MSRLVATTFGTSPRAAIWRAFLACGVIAVGVCYVFTDPVVVSWASSFVGVGAAIAIAVGVALNRPPRAWAWLALALGVSFQGAGDFVWTALSPNGVDGVPVPSLADAVYLSGYLALFVGIVALVRRQAADGDLATFIDVSIISLGIGVLAWVLLIEPATRVADGSVAEVAVTAAYPLLDLALAIVLVQTILTTPARSRSIDFLTLALFAFVVSDVVYLRTTIDGSYTGGGLTDLGWFVGYLFWGAAALHPSSRFLGARRAEPTVPRFSVWRAGSLTASCLVAPLAVAWTSTHDQSGSVPIILVASATMIVLWAIRVTVTVRRLRQALDDRRALEGRLREQTLRDPLVGLWNRSAFAERLNASLAEGEAVAVLYLDLDDFKVINDTFGHVAGDSVLVQVADRIGRVLRSTDVGARLGGDEFGVLLRAADARLGETVAARILESLLPPLTIEGRTVYLRGSIGISYGGAGKRPEELMREADVAMYLAKGQGKARFQVFETAMHESVMRRIALRSELEDAIANGEFVVHYQPIVAASREKVLACEALVRWEHPQRGLVLPDEFIDLAEETGLIVPLGRFVLEEACREAARWADVLGGAAPAVSVNVSAVQFRHPAFMEVVASAISGTGLDPRKLVLEVTESILIDVANAAAIIPELRDLGIRIAVDDFGTGYSSLAYLARYPIDILKIDRAFVGALGSGAREDRLAAAIVNLSHDLQMAVVAEGVETEAQLERLILLGCGWVQGYLIARPMPAKALRDLIGAAPVRTVQRLEPGTAAPAAA